MRIFWYRQHSIFSLTEDLYINYFRNATGVLEVIDIQVLTEMV